MNWFGVCGKNCLRRKSRAGIKKYDTQGLHGQDAGRDGKERRSVKAAVLKGYDKNGCVRRQERLFLSREAPEALYRFAAFQMESLLQGAKCHLLKG